MTHYRIDTYGYLNGVDTEPRDDATWLTTAPPVVPDGQFARWNGSSWEIVAEPSPVSFEPAIADLWQQADALASSLADQNARARFLAWLIDPSTPQAAKGLIAQLQSAMDSIWEQYAAGKAAILAGTEPAPIEAPSDLPTFWDVAAAAVVAK